MPGFGRNRNRFIAARFTRGEDTASLPGNERLSGAHGIEATGQRLIFMIGQILVFIVTLIPAAALFAGVFFLVKMLLGTVTAIPLASMAAALVLAVEAGFGIMLLGWLFDRFDVAAEQTA
jgi:hypothetical protein